jgi:ribonuclease P protein component
MLKQSFSKTERLSSRKLIEMLFKSNLFFFQYPFKVLYLEVELEHSLSAQVLISVSKKNFKLAIVRNRIKRLIREAYRKNKNILYEKRNNESKLLLLGLIFTGKTIPEYGDIEQKIILILQRLNELNGKAVG